MIESALILKEEDYKRALLEAERELAILSLKYNLLPTIPKKQFPEEGLEVFRSQPSAGLGL